MIELNGTWGYAYDPVVLMLLMCVTLTIEVTFIFSIVKYMSYSKFWLFIGIILSNFISFFVGLLII